MTPQVLKLRARWGMRLVLGRIMSWALTAGGWLLFGARTVLDLIGYSTIPDDVAVAKTRIDQAIGLFLSIPWWALLGFALISTLWLMRVSWPKNRTNSPNDVAESVLFSIIFSSDLSAASPIAQDGVSFYYWTHIPSVGIDFENKNAHSNIGYILVFMSFVKPTHTNYSQCAVVGGGINCELLSAMEGGAVVRCLGDLRGRTLSVKFGKSPLPLS